MHRFIFRLSLEKMDNKQNKVCPQDAQSVLKNKTNLPYKYIY